MAKAVKNLSPLEFTAIGIAVKKHCEQQRGELSPGRGQPVDVTIHVAGAVDIGDEQTFQRARKPDAQLLLSLVLQDLGPRQAAGVLKNLEPRMVELSRGVDPPELEAETSEAIDRLIKLGEVQETQTRRGSVTGALSIELVARAKARKAA